MPVAPTNLALRHDGNEVFEENNLPNPIARWAGQGLVEISFPASHPMARWTLAKANWIPFVGRFGDSVDFSSLATELQVHLWQRSATRCRRNWEFALSPGD